VELPAAFGTARSDGLIWRPPRPPSRSATSPTCFGEDEDWLHNLSFDTFPEDSRLHIYGVGDDGETASTEYGIGCLRQMSPMRESLEMRRRD
jgi:hypothetical protein